MVTPGLTPDNYCHEKGLYGGWEQNPKELTCQKNYCPMPRPAIDGIWFFGCTDEESQKKGIITEGGSCELRCKPGFQRLTPQADFEIFYKFFVPVQISNAPGKYQHNWH